MHGFPQQYGPWAVIAGASEGIGRAFAEALARRGLNLILIARREAPLRELATDLAASHNITTETVPMDLADPGLYSDLQALSEKYEIGLLVYNACYSEIGEFFETSLDSKLLSLDVNCRGPLVAVSALAPSMRRRGKGGVVLMSSMSGFQGSAMVSTYAATKAFNTVLGEGLWEELRRDGVDVLTMVAGATKTPNFQAATPDEKQSMTFPMTPDAVVAQALRDLGKKPTSIAGTLNSAVHFVFSRLVSRRRAIEFFANTTRKVYQPS